MGDVGELVKSLGGAVSSLFTAQGNAAMATSYQSAAALEEQNAQLTAASTRIQQTQTARTVALSLGTTQADVAGAGFTESGSALDILKASAQQGALAKSLINIQGAINENAFAAEAGADLAKASAANTANTAGTIGAIASGIGGLISGGSSIISGISSIGSGLNSVYNYLTGASGIAAVGTVLPGGGVVANLGSGISGGDFVAGAAAANAGSAAGVSATDASVSAGASLTDSIGSVGIGADLIQAGAGAVGSIAGNLFATKVLGENATGASVGGTIGAIAGAYFGGPIGSFAGSFLGSIVGGLFGNSKPSDSTEVGGVSLMNGQVNPVYMNQESDTGSKYSAQNAAIANNAQIGASNLATFLLANGATPSANTQKYNPNLVIKIGSRDGLQIGTQNEGGGSNALSYTQNLSTNSTSEQLITAVNQVVLAQYNIPPALQAQLSKLDLKTFYNGKVTPPPKIMA